MLEDLSDPGVALMAVLRFARHFQQL